MEEDLRPIRSITFDKKAQDNLPEWVKEKMKKDRENAKNKKCGCQSSKGFNPDLPDNCSECPNIRIEWIICPDCSMNQEAAVIPTTPFETKMHECEQCGYLITEREWDTDEG